MQILYKRMQMKPFTICPATSEHLPYVDAVVQAIADASRAKGTGLALRSHDYVRSKIEEGKAVIALFKDEFAGFCYIESWEHSRYVATSGLIVQPQFRGHGLAMAIKKAAFHLARQKFPGGRALWPHHQPRRHENQQRAGLYAGHLHRTHYRPGVLERL